MTRRRSMFFRRMLILSHRWLGIPMSVVFVVWFASGIVMMYAGGMPEVGAATRLERLAPIDLGAVRLSPAEAAEISGFFLDPGYARLLTVMGRPAYRFGTGPDALTVFADTGEVLATLEPEASRRVASRFIGVPEQAVRFVGTVTEIDQWTLTHRRSLPLHKFQVDDAARSEVYVSPEQAEVAVATTRRSRTLAWIGTIPHWFYFTPLRTNQPLWYWSIVWTSVLGCVLVVLGLALGVTQFRRTRPFRLSRSIRYRGWMRWHYILGVLFGVFALTWAFSGLMSVEPFAWMSAQGISVRGDTLSGGPLELEEFGRVEQQSWQALLAGRALKELEYRRIQGEPYYLARTTDPGELLVEADSMTVRTELFDIDELLVRLAAALPAGVHMTEHALLHEYDHYYYSRTGEAPLPVLRVKLDDPLETWVYVDVRRSELIGLLHRLSRLERWLFNGLHSLDFAFLYGKRPLWDIVMIVLSLGALVTSAIGLVFGIRRLGRTFTPRAR